MWDDQKVERLKDLWSKGHTASEIAGMLGDTTRNAVIGKAHRLNLEARGPSKQIQSSNKQEKKQARKTQQPMSRKNRFRALLLDKNFEPENPKKLEELTDKHCRFMMGHPDEENFYFCGRTPVKDFSYCKLHVLQCFQQKDAKEEIINKEDDVPAFLEKKIKSAG